MFTPFSADRILPVIKQLTDRGIVMAAEDNGHSAHKITALIKGKVVGAKVQTLVSDTIKFTSTAGVPEDSYTVDGVPYTCSPNLTEGKSVGGRSYQTSAENRALIGAALDELGIFGQPVVLGTTMPLTMYFDSEGKPNTAVIREFGNKIREPNSIRKDSTGEFARIVTNKVIPESLAAYYDYLIADDFSIRKDVAAKGLAIGVIDIGGKTTDVVTIINGKTVDHSRTKTLDIGVLDLHKPVGDLLRSHIEKINPSALGDGYGALPKVLLESCLNNDAGIVGGIDLSVLSEQIREIKEAHTRKIVSAVNHVIASQLMYSAILIAGGGSIVLGEHLQEHYRGSQVLDEFANSRGLLKMLLMLYGKDLTEEVLTGEVGSGAET